MEHKLYVIQFDVALGSFIGPAPWTVYPYGVELVSCPRLSCDDKGAHLTIMVRCTPAIGKEMGWMPLERLAPSTVFEVQK